MLGEWQRYTDDRNLLIGTEDPITPRNLSIVSVPLETQWMRAWIEKAVFSWCDENGNGFSDDAELEKAKRKRKGKY